MRYLCLVLASAVCFFVSIDAFAEPIAGSAMPGIENWEGDFDPQRHGKLCDDEPYRQSSTCQDYLAQKEGLEEKGASITKSVGLGGEDDGNRAEQLSWDEKRETQGRTIKQEDTTQDEQITVTENVEDVSPSAGSENQEDKVPEQQMTVATSPECSHNSFGICSENP